MTDCTDRFQKFCHIRTKALSTACPPHGPTSPNVQAKHTCQYVGGFLASTGEEGSPGSSGGGSAIIVKAMVAGDVAECADMFIAAHGRDCGWDRRADIEQCLGSGFPFPM